MVFSDSSSPFTTANLTGAARFSPINNGRSMHMMNMVPQLYSTPPPPLPDQLHAPATIRTPPYQTYYGGEPFNANNPLATFSPFPILRDPAPAPNGWCNYGMPATSPPAMLKGKRPMRSMEEDMKMEAAEMATEARKWRKLVRDQKTGARQGRKSAGGGGGGGVSSSSSDIVISSGGSSGSALSRVSAAVIADVNPPTPNTGNMRRLKFLLQKELRNSDVSLLGRIVLPKKDAEARMPILEVKEGMMMMVRDVFSADVWKMKYRFWPNNKSRMYVLESTEFFGYKSMIDVDSYEIDKWTEFYGDFTKKYNLKSGDFIALYQGEDKQMFICARKVDGPAVDLGQAPNQEKAKEVGTKTMQEEPSSSSKHIEEIPDCSHHITKANDPQGLMAVVQPWESSEKEDDLPADASSDEFDAYNLSQFEGFIGFDEYDFSNYVEINKDDNDN